MKKCAKCKGLYHNTEETCPRCGVAIAPVWVDEEEIPLRFEGLYVNKKPGAFYSTFLRFLRAGTVLETSSTGEAEDVIKWMSLGHEHVSVGKYRIEDGVIRFHVTSKYGDVVYSGFPGKEAVVLKSHSLINDHRDKLVFEFVSVADEW